LPVADSLNNAVRTEQSEVVTVYYEVQVCNGSICPGAFFRVSLGIC